TARPPGPASTSPTPRRRRKPRPRRARPCAARRSRPRPPPPRRPKSWPRRRAFVLPSPSTRRAHRRYRPLMADATPAPTVLLPETEVAAVVADLARRVAPHVDDETAAVVLLTGGLWFAADLTRALS